MVLTLDRDGVVVTDSPAILKAETLGPRIVAITYDKDRANAGQILSLVQAQGFGIADVSTREADLEDVFVRLTSATQAG